MRDEETKGGAETQGGVERRAVLKAIGLGGAVLLVPRAALAEGLTIETEDPSPMQAAVVFGALSGKAAWLVKSGETLPTLEKDGVRFLVDAHRTTDGNSVVVAWGTDAFSVGSGNTAMTVSVGDAPAVPKTVGNVTTFTIKLEIKIDASANSVSIISPGGDPH